MDFSKHGENTTSVKVHHAPGGRSNFSLAWGEPEPVKRQAPTVSPVVPQQPLRPSNHILPSSNESDAKTSVKVRNPPGGRSSITFG